MIKTRYANINVVQATRLRLKELFKTAPKVYFNTSGGKDSIVLNDILFKLCATGEVDKSKLEVSFIDEEAIYDCIEKTVMNMRKQWLSIGVPFIWYCLEVKHYNCLNSLSKDESFICWDRYKEDVWVRKMPKFAVKSEPLLNARHETYQDFFDKKCRDGVTITGVRVQESVQRLYALANSKYKNMLKPIYDWTDSDVWRYIFDNDLDFPEAYIYMYQVGIPRNKLRISQFFSIDTCINLVHMNEFYPDLFARVCKREPNAYLAILYYDTEMFRRSNENKQHQNEQVNYKEKTFNLLKDKDLFNTVQKQKLLQNYRRIILKLCNELSQKQWKTIYQALVAGDPKQRTLRSVFTQAAKEFYNKENK